MGFFFRKSIGRGPLRINLSKSGIGWSLGIPGLRFGRSATGRNTTRIGIPGTGAGWQSGSSGTGCLVPIVIGALIMGGGLAATILHLLPGRLWA